MTHIAIFRTNPFTCFRCGSLAGSGRPGCASLCRGVSRVLTLETNADGVKDSALDRAEAHGAGAVFGVALQGALEPNTLAVGAQPEHRCRDTPWPLAFGVGARPPAGVVMAMQPPREIVASVWGVGQHSNWRM